MEADVRVFYTVQSSDLYQRKQSKIPIDAQPKYLRTFNCKISAVFRKIIRH